MKILHLCLANFYIDNYSYQENLLPKYHKKMGLDVEIIGSLFSFDENGEGYYATGRKEYRNENGIPVTRLEYKDNKYSKRFRLYKGTYDAIVRSTPDIIFIHGCQFLDIKEVVRYAKSNPSVKIYVDNHADFSNSATNWLSKNVLHKIIWRRCAQLIEPYTIKFYGVLPARVDFLKKIYKVPEEKVKLLVMGADDEKIEKSSSDEVRHNIRKKFGIDPDDFLIVTGGKIDTAKRQVIDLMKVINKINKPNVKLLVYGSVINEMKEEVNQLLHGESVKYIGWISNDKSYELFSSADLLIFPGRHSVYWEQVVAMGKPLVVKHWEGTTHIDIGGNCVFLYDDTEDEMSLVLKNIINNPNVYADLLKNAQKKKKSIFLYSEIAEASIKEK